MRCHSSQTRVVLKHAAVAFKTLRYGAAWHVIRWKITMQFSEPANMASETFKLLSNAILKALSMETTHFFHGAARSR
jgi:hypothetical protein